MAVSKNFLAVASLVLLVGGLLAYNPLANNPEAPAHTAEIDTTHSTY